MPVIAVGGDTLVALFRRRFQPDDDGFLSDVEVTEPPDQTHAVKLAGLFFKPADQKHVAVIGFQLVCRCAAGRFACSLILGSGFAGRHVVPPPIR